MVRMPITSRHVEAHTYTSQGLDTGACTPTIIQFMDDGGPIPMLMDFNFVAMTYNAYHGTFGFGPLPGLGSYYAPQNEWQMQNYLLPSPGQFHYTPSLGQFEGEIVAATTPIALPQQPPAAPIQGVSANLPIVIEDDDNGVRNPIPAPKEATPKPLPPSHLKERLAHLRNYVIDKTQHLMWLESMKLGSYKQQEEYCRMFWPSNEPAEVDLDWAVRHFKDFTEAYIERLAVEGRKKKEGLDWEKEGAKIAAEWEKRIEGRSEKARKEKELEESKRKAAAEAAARATRQAQLEERRRIRAEEMKKKYEEEKEKREALRRAADEEKRRNAEEERAEKQRAKEEERTRKAEEKKAQRATASSKKRKAAPESTEPAKKQKTGAQLPTPPTSENGEMRSVEAIEAKLVTAVNIEDEGDDDGLLAATMAYLDSHPAEDSEEESDADDDESFPVFRVQAKEVASEPATIPRAQADETASEPPTQAITPQEHHTPSSTPPAQTSEPEGEVGSEEDLDSLFDEEDESEDDVDSLFDDEVDEEEDEGDDDMRDLFDMEAEEASEDEDESESEEEEEPVPRVLSPREKEVARIDEEVEELKGKIERTQANVLFQRRLHQRINNLRVERENLQLAL